MKNSLIISAFAIFALAALPSHAFAVDQAQYEWQGTFEQVINGTPNANAVYQSTNTFPTSAACYSDLQAAKDPNNPSWVLAPVNFTCNCDKPISAQPACPGYTAPATTGSATGGTPASTTNPPVTTAVTSTGTGFVPLAPIPGLTDNQSGVGSNSLPQFLKNLYKYLIGLAALLAVIEIIYGGLQYATQDSISAKGEGRTRIEHALLGLVLVLSPALVFSIINPSIINLSVNLPALNTASGTYTPGNSIGNSQPPTNLTVGSPVVVNGVTVNKQFSATPEEAQNFVSSCTSAGGVGYYAGGVLGNLVYDGQSCTAQSTSQSVTGSQVTSQTTCNQYAYTAFCSKVTTLTVVSKSVAYLNSGDPSFSDPAKVAPYGDSVPFVSGCLNQDHGYISRSSAPVSVPTCPGNILDLMKTNGMSPPASCFQFTAHCQIKQ